MPDAVPALLRECFAADPARRPTGMDVVAEGMVEVYEAGLGRRYPREAGVTVAHLADGLSNKALSLLDLGQGDDAESCWEQALRTDSRHPNATFNRGITRWRAAAITDRQLVDDLETVREADAGAGVTNGRAPYLLGLVHLERGDGTAAVRLLGEDTRLAPADPEITAALRSATTDQTIRAAEPRTLTGRTRVVTTLAMTPDGRYALSGSDDRTLRCWDLTRGRCLRTLTGPSEAVTSVAVTDDARHVIAGGLDATVRWWELTLGIAAPWSYSRPQAAADVSAQTAEFRSRIDEARRSLDREDHAAAAAVLRPARAIPGYARHPELTDLWHRAGRGGRRTVPLDARQVHTFSRSGHGAGIRSVAVTPDARLVSCAGNSSAISDGGGEGR
jgi:tetratricopeptide (TPR) repeat protein